jgi:hypothetical protein
MHNTNPSMSVQCNPCTVYSKNAQYLNHLMKRVTLQWRQFWAFMWSFVSPFSSETYLQEREWSKVISNVCLGYKALLIAYWLFHVTKDNSRWHAHLHTRKLELDSNVTLVQHTEEDLRFQVLWDPSSEDEEAGRAHGWCCSCTGEIISHRSIDYEGYTVHARAQVQD